MRVYLTKEFDVRCPFCQRIVSYSNRYDALFCRPCDAWLENQCADPACEFCAGRASRPDDATDLDEAQPAEAEHAPPIGVVVPPPPTVGKNRPCPCNSGKKFKLCCGFVAKAPKTLPKKEGPKTNLHFLERLSRLIR